MAGYVNTDGANPYLTQYSQQMSGWSGDPYAAYMAQNSTQGQVLQNQQDQILGNGGFGYIAGGGNDQSGSSFGNAMHPQAAPANPWGQGAGGGFSDPSFAYQAPGSQLAGNNGLGVVAPGTPYMTQADENAAIALSTAHGAPGYFQGQTWVPTPSTPATNNPASLTSAASQGPGGYPTYQNQYGLGSQTGSSGASSGGAAATSTPAPSVGVTPQAAFQMTPSPNMGNLNSSVNVPQNSNTPLNATTGFNPWSLQGEANSVKS